MLAVSPAGTQYYAKYGYLARMSSTSGLGRVFGNGVSTHNSPLVKRMSREVLTGIRSFDPRLMNFQRKFVNDVNKAVRPNLDADGFTTHGIHAPFDRLLTTSGFMPNPMSYTPLHNGFYRKELGLSPGYSAVQKRIAVNAWKIIFSHYAPSHVKVPKKSTSGPRRNTSDAEWKTDFALFLYESDRFEAMLKCVESDDWQTLANELEMWFMMYIQKRDQVDMPGKERLVFDLEYALSNGARGKAFPTDKTVTIDGKVWDDFSATRARVIHAGPWVINCVLQIISSGHMLAMFERFPKVFHVSTPEQIKAVIDYHYVECGDVKEYDRSMSKDAIDTCLEVAAEFWDPRMIKMARLLYYSPYYSRPLDLDGREGTFVGDPRLMTEQVICGNRSGHAWTSFVAKVNKCIDTLFIFHAMGLSVLDNELTYFESRGAINFINNGDDEQVYTKSKELLDKYKKVRYDKVSHGHYIVESEVGQGFSGLLMIKNPDLTYTPTAKIHTAFEKIYVPERDIGGFFRPYWPIGIIDRVNRQDETPMGGLIWEIHNRTYADMLAPHFGSFLTIVNNAMERLPVQVDGLSNIDKDVLEDNDRIHYKYTEKDVNPDVFKLVTSKIEYGRYEHIVNSHYSGNLH